MVCELHATNADRAVLAVMQGAVPDVHYIQVLKRAVVGPELNLVIVLGTSKDRPAGKGDSAWWGNGTTLGILLQRRNHPGTIYQIAASRGEGDCEIRVERATAQDVVLSCTPEKGRAC